MHKSKLAELFGTTRSSRDVDSIWKQVFSFPIYPTWTLLRSPFSAIRSLNAETPISRQSIRDTGTVYRDVANLDDNNIKAVATIN